MKAIFYSLLFLTLSSYSQQYTIIPDPLFETEIDDERPLDGRVLTSKINTITNLNLSSRRGIQSLQGIEDFTLLETLDCSNNELTILNVSTNLSLIYLKCTDNKLVALSVPKSLGSIFCGNNLISALDLSGSQVVTASCENNVLGGLDIGGATKLETLNCYNNKLSILNINSNSNLVNLDCSNNQITGLDTSNNTKLERFFCSKNLLTTFDVTNNPKLGKIDCSFNRIMSIDVSKNNFLTNLYCNDNMLNSVNFKNGNNQIINILSPPSDFRNNPNLTCIEVDYADSSGGYFGIGFSYKDPTTSYSTNCNTLDVNDLKLENISLYPNPTNGLMYINNLILEKVSIYDTLGREVKRETFINNNSNNTLDLSNLPKGIYYIYLLSKEGTAIKKIIID